MRISLLAVLLLSGCASITADSARQMNPYELCKTAYASGHSRAERGIAMDELQVRGQSCEPFASYIQAEMAQKAANNAAMAAYGMAILNANQPPRPTTCTGQQIGNMWQEVCR